MFRCQCLAPQNVRDLFLELFAPLLSDANLEVGQLVSNSQDGDFRSRLDLMLAIQNSEKFMRTTCHLFGYLDGVIGLDAEEVVIIGEARQPEDLSQDLLFQPRTAIVVVDRC